MKQHPIHEGYMPYLGYQTYYRIVGEPSNKPALLLLHGGVFRQRRDDAKTALRY